MDIGKLEPVPLRELWKHEERGFSAWLEQNLSELADELGVSLIDPRREVKAGKFEVDIVAETDSGATAVIENQLGPTDHDHLGKLLTYIANLDAKIAVWVTSDSRAEHIRAIQWLNETTPDDTAFYLVRLSAYRIGQSAPAPLFTTIVGPSAASKDMGKQKKEMAERHVLRYDFWKELLARAKARGLLLHAARAPSRDHWLGAGAGVRSGVSYNYLIWMDEAGVELYIDTGDHTENKRIFDSLYAQKAQIESAYGGPIVWERLDEKRASRIRCEVADQGVKTDVEQWPAVQDAMIDAMRRLSTALKEPLRKV